MKFKAIVVYLLLIVASIFLVDIVKAQSGEATAALPATVSTELIPAPSTVPTSTSVSAASTEGSSGSTGWGLNFFSLGGIYEKQFEIRDPSMNFFENYLGLSYRPNRDLRLGVRYSFTYKTDGFDELGREVNDANKTESADMSVLATIKNILEDEIPSAMELKVQPRVYLPTSDKSRASGMIASLRLENEMRYYFNRSQSIRAWFQPRYYFQRNTAYVNDAGKFRTTEMFQSKHGLEFSQGLTKWFAFKPGFEIEESWSNASPANNLSEFRDSKIDYRLGFEFTISREINTTLGLAYNQDLYDANTFQRQMTLMTNVSIF